MENLWKDIKFAFRTLIRKPGFTAVAVLSLTLGIGANTTIFALVKAVFLQSVPAQDPDRLIDVFSTQENRGGAPLLYMPSSYLNARDYREKNDVFNGLSVLIGSGGNLDVGSGKDVQLFVDLVNWDFFDIMGVRPAMGRTFIEDEDKTPGARPVVIISNAIWKNQFGSDPSILGKNIKISNQDYAVIGVAPVDFHDIPGIGSPDVWIPIMMHDQVLTGIQKDWFNQRGARMVNMVGRMKPGVTPERAQLELTALGNRLSQEYPTDNGGRNVIIMPLSQTNVPPNQRAFFTRAGLIVSIVVGLVLLIACANVANLLLTRATQRQREIAIRLSMGASRGRLIRQLLTESLLIALTAGVLGIVFAYWTRGILVKVANLPPNLDLSLDARVIFYAFWMALLATVLFGLMPALQASSPSRISALRDRTNAPTGSAKWYGLRGVLVMTQIALSLIALVGAGLFIHSLKNAQEIDPGFETQRELLLGLPLGVQKYNQGRAEQFHRDVVQRLSTLPMVTSAAIADVPPFGQNLGRTIFPEGVDVSDPRNGKMTPVVAATPGYFSTMSIPLIEGREFDDHDDASGAMVAIVNQAFADRTWPRQDALGKHLHFLLQNWDVTVVGVAKTVKFNTLGEPPTPVVYYPMKQHYTPNVMLYVKTKGDPNAAVSSVRTTVQSLDSSLQLRNVGTVQQRMKNSLQGATLLAELLGSFGILALLLAALGTYGVMAYSVSQRTQEIGIRMAMGAQPGSVLGLILGSGMAMVGAGVIAGLGFGIVLTRSMNTLLYGIGNLDLATFGATSAILLAVAFLACYLPARRAMRVDPLVALRYE